MMLLEVLLAAALQAGGGGAAGAGTLPVQKVVRDVNRPRVAVPPRTPPRTAKRTKALPRVVIDAGHGGVDGGGPIHGSKRFHEKDITLQVAIRLGDLLKQRGVEVFYTRVSDTLIALADRGRMANQANADVFVSIHVNAANPRWRDPGAARGFETYFLAEAKTEDARHVEAIENESVRFESQTDVKADDPLSFILRDMEQNQYLRESSDFAEIMQRRLAKVHPGPNRGVKQAGFRVLLTAFMPAVLVELGFGTNEKEAEYLASPYRQRELARAIADATAEYLERYQKRVGSNGLAPGGHD